MRKFMHALVGVFLTVLLLCTVSCSDEAVYDDGTLKIVTTAFPPYDFARQIAEGTNGVEVTMLLPPGSESHDYEPSVSDIATVGKADLIICIGGETDSWIDGVIKASESKASVLRLTDMVELLEEDETVLVTSEDGHHGHSHEHSHKHTEECTFDEHVWTSPENAAVMTEKIASAMCRLSESDSETFRKNCEAYASSLREVQVEMKKLTAECDSPVLIFADRFPFRYLADSLGVKCYAAFAGCASDSEATLEAVYRLCKLAEENGSEVIFTCEFSSRNAADLISRETGCEVRELHSCHNVSKEDFDGGVTYLSLMRRNLQYLKEAMCKK